MVQTIRHTSRGLPLERDLLDGELDTNWSGFTTGQKIFGGMAIPAAEGSWNESRRVPGKDWELLFYPPRGLKTPFPNRDSGRVSWRTIKPNCVLALVRTGLTSVNEARDVGRPAVRALLALVQREYPMILLNDPSWEGPLIPTPRGFKMATVRFGFETTEPISGTRISKAGLALAKVSIQDLPPPVSRALLWLSLARSANVRQEKFVHLWMAIRSITDHGQPNKGHQLTRAKKYTATMGYGVAGVLSPSRIAELDEKIERAYHLRTDLLHRDKDSGIDNRSLDEMENVAFQLVDFELAKVGIKIAG
jgi:hypothetical protein